MHPCDTLTGVRAVTPEFLAEHRRDRLEVVTDRLVETIQRDNAGYRHAGVVPLADLRQSCHDNVARVLELLAEAVEVGTVTPRGDREPAYDAARATGRRRAEQGLPLDDVLRSFRIGGDVRASKDLGRFVRWPKYVRIQRQRKVRHNALRLRSPCR